jgi:hypothetical protein
MLQVTLNKYFTSYLGGIRLDECLSNVHSTYVSGSMKGAIPSLVRFSVALRENDIPFLQLVIALITSLPGQPGCSSEYEVTWAISVSR